MFTMGMVIFSTTLLALIVVGAIVAVGVCLRRDGFRRGDSRLQNEETRIIQELHDQLNRMEARIETLETIIIENHRKAPDENF